MDDIHLDLAGPGARLALAAAKASKLNSASAGASAILANSAAARALASANLSNLSYEQIQQFAAAITAPYSDLATQFEHLEEIVVGHELPDGGDFSGFYPSYVASLAALTAIAVPFDGQTCILTHSIRAGTFVWRQGNYVAQVAADTEKGMYAKADTIPTTNGAWVRLVADNRYLAKWWGTSAVRTDNEVPLMAGINVVPDGAVFVIPPYTCLIGSTVFSRPDRSINIVAEARHISGISPSDPNASFDTLHVPGSGSSVRGLKLSSGESTLAANEPVALCLGLGAYTGGVVGGSYPIEVTDMLAEDNLITGGDSGIMCYMSFTAYRPGSPVPNVTTGVSLTWEHIYALRRATVRHNIIRARRNAIAFYGVIDGHEHHNDVKLYEGSVTPVFTSGLRCLGVDNMDSHNSAYEYEIENQRDAYGIYYALVAINAGEVKLNNIKSRITNHSIVRAPIPFEIESWDGGSLTLTDHKVRKDILGTVTYPIIRSNIQGPIGGQKYMRTEGFKRLHIARIDAEGGTQLIQCSVSVKDFVIDGCTWVGNAYSTPDGMFPIDLRDLTRVNDGDGAPFPNRGNGLIRILNNELLSNTASYAEIAVYEAVATTKVIAERNRSVASTGGGAPRPQFLFTGTVGATITTDGATEQAVNMTITPGLNYRYPSGARALAASGG